MILTSKSVRRLITELKPPLVDIVIPDGASAVKKAELQKKREALKTSRIEGACFDLELAVVERKADFFKVPFLGRETRMIPPTVKVDFAGEALTGYPDVWRLHDQRSYKLQSLETINMPPYLMGLLHMRTSFFRANGGMSWSFIKPGFSGRIVIEAHMIEGEIDVQQGWKFISLAFARFTDDKMLKVYMDNFNKQNDEIDVYDGIWSGSKITTNGEHERAA